MLGLGLGVSKVSSLRSLAAKLLAKLKSRSTYYENNKDSKQVVQDLDTIDVLDKASILLTPTATSNARVHCVKPSLPDYGKNLIPNSDDANNWTILNSTGTIVNENGYLKLTDTSGSFGYAYIPITVETGKDYIITYNLVDSGTSSANYVRVGNGTNTTNYHSENGFTDTGKRTIRISPSETTIYITLISGAGINKYAYWTDITVQATADFDFDRASSATRINSDGLVQDMQSITDPELVINGDFEELGSDIITNGTFDTDSDWSLGSGWSIADGKLVGNGTMTASDTANQAYNFTDGNTYKFTFEITESTQGTVFIREPFNGDAYATGEVGTHTVYGVAGAANELRLRSSDSFIGKIDNVSVQQVDPNARWIAVGGTTADNYVEFTEGFARLKFLNSSPITTLRSTTASLVSGRTYRLIVDVHDATSGAIKIDGGGVIEVFSVEGVTTRYITPNSNTTLSFYRATANVDITLASVSLEDITFSEDVDLARINYDSNGENGHWLLEPTSTNLVTYSEDFSQSFWNGSTYGQLSSDNLVSAPDNSISAQKWKRTSGTYNMIRPIGNITGTDKTLSVFVKNISADSFYLRGSSSFYFYNFSSQTVSNSNLKAEQYPNGWIRLSTSDTNDNFKQFGIGENETDSTGLNNEVYIWGAQIEALPYATSYIPTYGSTVTRAAETLNNSGNSSLINSTEGVLYFEGSSLIELVGVNTHITISNGSDSNRLYFYYDTNGRFGFASFVNGVLQANITYDGIIAENSKVACKYKENDYAMWIDGVERGTDTSASVWSSGTLDALSFANPSASTNYFYGKVKALAVFDEALTDTELQNLTS